ncbi:MAG: hypothetical protein WBD28_11615 [Candidatus Zixiibacteriota bacterium]
MKNLFPILFLSLFLFLFCCGKSEIENLQMRLDDFRDVLPEELRMKFDSGDYQNVVIGLDSLLSSDLNFKKKHERLKDKEAINVFSAQEVVDFYREYFVERMEKLKRKKD